MGVSVAGAGGASPSDPRPPGEPPRKGRGGAPRGNLNALKHGLFSKAVQRTRDTFRRRAQREVHAILKYSGIEHDPLAVLVGRQLGRLETVASRLEMHLEKKGYFVGRTGDPKAAVARLVETTDRLLGEARRLLEQLAERPGRSDGVRPLRFLLPGGAELPHGATGYYGRGGDPVAPAAPGEARRGEDGPGHVPVAEVPPAAEPASEDAPPPSAAAVEEPEAPRRESPALLARTSHAASCSCWSCEEWRRFGRRRGEA